MLKSLTYLATILLLLSCHSQPKLSLTEQLLQMAGRLDSKQFEVIDSLNSGNISVINLWVDDSIAYAFVRDSHWQLIDSLDGPFYLKVEDMNGDGVKDVMAAGPPDMHGMRSSYIYLHRQDSFVKAVLPGRVCEAKYDSATNVVRSYYESGAYGLHNKQEYRWQKDRLVLLRGISMDLSNQDYIITTWYHGVGDGIVTDKVSKDSTETPFDTEFWEVY